MDAFPTGVTVERAGGLSTDGLKPSSWLQDTIIRTTLTHVASYPPGLRVLFCMGISSLLVAAQRSNVFPDRKRGQGTREWKMNYKYCTVSRESPCAFCSLFCFVSLCLIALIVWRAHFSDGEASSQMLIQKFNDGTIIRDVQSVMLNNQVAE